MSEDGTSAVRYASSSLTGLSRHILRISSAGIFCCRRDETQSHIPSAGVLYQGPGLTLGWHHDRDSADALQGGLADGVGVCVQ